MANVKTLNGMGLVSLDDLKVLAPLFTQTVQLKAQRPTTVTEFFAVLDECKRIIAELEGAQMETVRGELLRANLMHSFRKFHESLSHANAALIGHVTGMHPSHVTESEIVHAFICWEDHHEAFWAVFDEYRKIYEEGKRAQEEVEERKMALESICAELRPRISFNFSRTPR